MFPIESRLSWKEKVLAHVVESECQVVSSQHSKRTKANLQSVNILHGKAFTHQFSPHGMMLHHWGHQPKLLAYLKALPNCTCLFTSLRKPFMVHLSFLHLSILYSTEPTSSCCVKTTCASPPCANRHSQVCTAARAHFPTLFSDSVSEEQALQSLRATVQYYSAACYSTVTTSQTSTGGRGRPREPQRSADTAGACGLSAGGWRASLRARTDSQGRGEQ